jgi:hypothetical protein
MSRQAIDRRQFLTLPLALFLAPLGLAPLGRALAAAPVESYRAPYGVDVRLLYGVLTYHEEGTFTQSIDRSGGSYEAVVEGEGDGIAHRIESTGVLRQGRWVPIRSHSFFSVKGRQSRGDITYDHARGRVEYHFKGETFFLRRLRVVDDVLSIPPGLLVDDSISATLNYTDRLWKPGPDGSLVTHVVRRKMAPDEGPDDVQAHARAELVPFKLEVTVDAATQKPIAHFDLTRFSSWARQSQPGRVTFGPDRRPEQLSLPLILGTSVQIRLKA